MNKRTLFVVGLGIILLNLFYIGGSINSTTIIEGGFNKAPTSSTVKLRPMYYSVGNLPYDLDPHNSWDFGSMDVIEQVCEGLFEYDLAAPDLAIIPKLALNMGTWNATGTGFTVDLRQWVYFQDGTPFDAWAVKWNFDRLRDFVGRGSKLFEKLQILQIFECPGKDNHRR